MLFVIGLSQEELEILFYTFRKGQEETMSHIRLMNRVMRTCFGDKNDSPNAVENIKFFNEQQKLLRKLADRAGHDFKKKLGPDDLKLWEELSPEARGLADRAESDEERDEEMGRLIVVDPTAWDKKNK